MVNVIKDHRSWYVRLTLPSDDCPYLYYPANYHGCRHDDRLTPDDACTLENCPIKYSE